LSVGMKIRRADSVIPNIQQRSLVFISIPFNTYNRAANTLFLRNQAAFLFRS
jgi:hypothetical protein